jgi:hypothetical protein
MTLDLFDTRRQKNPRDPGTPFAAPQDRTAELIERLVEQSSQVMVKKLATNDRQWAIWDDERGRWKSNQAGPLLPSAARESGFFPPLQPDPEKPHNRMASVHVYWPTTGKVYSSRFIWYSNKSDAEHHFTTNPRIEFADIAPASYLLMFKPKKSEAPYQALTVDAADEDLTDYISQVFEIREDFHFKVFEVSNLKLHPMLTAMQQLVRELVAKLDGSPEIFNAFVSTLVRRPAGVIAAAAIEQWKNSTGHQDLNPYKLTNPGDILYDITRNREFSIYKQDEAKTYGAQLVRALLGEGGAITREKIVASFIERFDVFYDICKSAKQARSSRAGGSFEIHMSSTLKDGGIPHASQFVFDGSKPDFILPSGALYRDAAKRREHALVLTLKTTLRERWKQVVSESAGCPIFLATLDESVPGKTLDKLKDNGITLVVPECFKASEYAEYKTRDNVISYRSFFDRLLDERTEPWLAEGIHCFGIIPESTV